MPPVAALEPEPKLVEVLEADVSDPGVMLDTESPKDRPEWETVSKVLEIPGPVAVTVAEPVPVGTRVTAEPEGEAFVDDAPVVELEPVLDPEPGFKDGVEPLLVAGDVAAVAPEGVVVAEAVEDDPAGPVVDSLVSELVLSPAPPPLPGGKEKLNPENVELLLLAETDVVTTELEVDDGAGVLDEADDDDDDGQSHGQQKLGNTGSEVAQSPKLSERPREMSFFSKSTSPKS